MQSRATSVAAYLKEQPPERRAALRTIRSWVREELPDARETMAMKMPTWELGGTAAVCLAAQKQYLALYLCETDVPEHHREAFAHLDVGKSCIRFKSLEDLSERDVRQVLKDTNRALGRA